MDATDATPSRIVSIPRWLSPEEAADALGISLRALQYRAKRGEIERKRDGRRSLYCVTHDAVSSSRNGATDARNDARTDAPTHAMAQSRATDESTHDTVLALADRLAAAESRAAVAEYRAEIAETDPDEIEALRAAVAERDATIADQAGTIEALRLELADVRSKGQALANAMVKRHGVIKRLAAKVRTLQG